ncbi:unnamed protein product, partial [Rotaria magnacalcarata]
IVECNLEIASAEEIEHYINELEKLAGHDYGDKLQEYKLRKDQDDDVQSFLIKKSESSSYYETESKKWKQLFRRSDSRSVLFIHNPKENIHRWEAWLWIPNRKEKIFTLEIFVSELLDLMEEKNVFSAVVSDIELKTHLFTDNQLNLKSRRSKMNHICESLSEAYRLIGYFPLEQRCRRAISYFREEKQRFLTKISSTYKINIRSMINHDNKWMKDSKRNILINRIVENIHLENVKIGENIRLINNDDFSYEQSRSHIENLAAELNLYRWYFYGELTYDRISEGFVDLKAELHVLEKYLKRILPEDLNGERNEKFFKEERKILNYLTNIFQIDNESSNEYFIKPIEKNNYERQRLLKRGILIYDLRKVSDGHWLKQEIKSDVKRNFAGVVRLTNQHCITVFIENKQPNKFNCDIRYIYVLISTDTEIDFSMLTWFTRVMDKCVYKLSIVECPQQRSMSEDRLLHSYLNATACHWAADNKCWKALKDNFYRQKFSSRENIEQLKKWFIEDNLN